VRSHGFKAATRYRDFKHIAAFSVTKLLFQVIAAPLERKLEDGLETLLLLERHTTRVVAEERKMREGLEKAGLKMTLRMEVGARTHSSKQWRQQRRQRRQRQQQQQQQQQQRQQQ
jgi:gamma-glutamyl:cysteine ligase YbdK (ATP-grasp superfamily)